MPDLSISSDQLDQGRWQFHDEIEHHKYNCKIAMNLPGYDIRRDAAEDGEYVGETSVEEAE